MQRAPLPSRAASEPATIRLVRRVLKLPRSVRIFIAAVFAQAVTFALSPVIDEIYLRYFFNESTRIVPSLVAAAAGLLMYALGWLLMVGTVHEPLPERGAVLWYCLVGLLAIALVTAMLVTGWTSGNTPTM
jgi:hypothetical protein